MSRQPSHESPSAPSPGADASAAPPSEIVVHESDVLKRRSRFSWRSPAAWKKFVTGEGFLVSVGLHLLLAVIAVFYVYRYAGRPKPASEVFDTGPSGGGKKAGPPVKVKSPFTMKSAARITSKISNAVVTLPSSTMMSPAAFGGLPAGGSGGLGGSGSGKGVGMGNGGGSGFVGRFLGMKLTQTKRVALYLDASGSMRPYLARVEAEAKRAFPTADVFKSNGAFVVVENGAVAWGRAGLSGGFKANFKDSACNDNDPAKFSPEGRRLLGVNNEKFQKGSAGAWFDIMIGEKYDALIVFSDFQDGFDQTNKTGEHVFRDKPIETTDSRKPDERAWENRWYSTLARASAGGAPRVYLFSIEKEPQVIWKKCAEVSGGAIRLIPWLTKPGGKPPEDEGDGIADGIHFKPGRDTGKVR